MTYPSPGAVETRYDVGPAPVPPAEPGPVAVAVTTSTALLISRPLQIPGEAPITSPSVKKQFPIVVALL